MNMTENWDDILGKPRIEAHYQRDKSLEVEWIGPTDEPVRIDHFLLQQLDIRRPPEVLDVFPWRLRKIADHSYMPCSVYIRDDAFYITWKAKYLWARLKFGFWRNCMLTARIWGLANRRDVYNVPEWARVKLHKNLDGVL